MIDLSVKLGPLAMKNPITTASGTFGFGLEFASMVDLGRLGAIVVKGTTLEPREGNPVPRMAETPGGMLNSIGLQNPGVDAFIRDYLPPLRAIDTPIIVNISGNTVEEYGELAAKLDQADGVAALEVNVSCPNVKHGGIQFGTMPESAAEVTRAVRAGTKKPVIVKLSPNVTDIVVMAEAVADAGADAVALINTLLGMAIDVKKRRPVLANCFGGLSGPAVKPVALRMIYQVHRAVKIPILGMGGVMNSTDALEMIMAGATAVAVGTANFCNPTATMEIIDGLQDFCRREGVRSMEELIGAAH
ncbi:dihydroorotate dehydrogenase [Heliophilum fasciatum]|uniref:Dihydroorotate dehydrogenase n=1 Tax=Heliophilum fasciatum TaxID=35700 RepID=A0A4R2RUU8_9FIRM|nr:dihydroorotate dehydrogenase [Heliophilum fasciatum]MCW2277223.1 dihydroorotate dehydrogenase (NAD+) catalytic subunit [Heliophilum fasciatum]TCP68142.1 dihydroorotate oxidase B catalytic subunit [Heliophilum fasciatum]